MSVKDTVVEQLIQIVEGLAKQNASIVSLIPSQHADAKRTTTDHAVAAMAFAKSLRDGLRCDKCKCWEPRLTSGLTSVGKANGYCRMSEIDAAKMWPELYDRIVTEPDFGCIAFSPIEPKVSG